MTWSEKTKVSQKQKSARESDWENEGERVVYMCIFFYIMQHYFVLPGWSHACILKFARVSHLELVFKGEDGE